MSIDSQLSGAVSELRAVAEGLGSAVTQTAGLAESAEAVQEQALGIGFEGIAERLDGVCEEAKELVEQLTGVRDQADSATQVAEKLPPEVTASVVITSLAPVSESLDVINGTVEGARQTIDRLRTEIAEILDGAQPEGLLEQASAVDEELAAVEERLTAAETAVDAVVSEAQQLGSVGGVGAPGK